MVVRRLGQRSSESGGSAVLPGEHLEIHFIWANPIQSFLFEIPFSGQDTVTVVMPRAIENAVIIFQSEA